MARYRRLIVACMLLPFILVALSSSDDDEKDEKPRAHTVVADLLHPDATLRDYRGASETQQERFLEYYTRFRFGEAEPVAMGELRRHLKSRFASLPAGGNPTDVIMAGAGRVSLWDAAEYAAKNLGWPRR